MEMGVIKPFEVTRAVAGSAALEAGASSKVVGASSKPLSS